MTKIRLTGGEPTVRKDIVPLIRKIGTLRSRGLKELAITTNGITLSRKLDDFVSSGLTGVNISLDTLDSLKFQIMTRRQGLESVLKTINRVLDLKRTGTLLNLKVNCVVMRGLNDKEIVHFVEYTRSRDVEVRFIEYMPFGGNKWSEQKMVPFREMLETIQSKYPDIHRLQGYANDTSRTYQIPGFAGRVGFITSMTNHFCNTCNRLRITGDGNLKVCLHGNAEVSLRDVLRQGNHGEPITETRFQELRLKEQLRASQEFTPDSNNGWLEHEERLLQVIGDAVKRKKAQHAGMGQLEKATNRPMILIGG